MDRPIRLAVLLSGAGTTLQNLLDRIGDGRLDARIAGVLSSKADTPGLARAEKAGLPRAVVERRACPDRAAFSRAVFDFCRGARADLVCLAGFLQLLEIPPAFANRVLNIHPALIPAFSGKGFHGPAVHRAALEAGVKVSGCTVHFADNEYDHGPIVSQRVVPVLDDDTPETLAARIFTQECEAYPEAIQWFAEGQLRVEGRRVRVLGRGG
jgi:formyltetrahydrofolate-dependent phosphoribosylglycinamide formyltransferase